MKFLIKFYTNLNVRYSIEIRTPANEQEIFITQAIAKILPQILLLSQTPFRKRPKRFNTVNMNLSSRIYFWQIHFGYGKFSNVHSRFILARL